MYYLLEDNTIIKRDRLEHWEENGVLHDHYKTYGKIKKKSENLIDLIEVGDLLRIKYIFKYSGFTEEYIHIREVIVKNKNVIEVEDYYNLKHEQILAIYKLNEKADYIKVWEKENEND